jgi:hypothetical protein
VPAIRSRTHVLIYGFDFHYKAKMYEDSSQHLHSSIYWRFVNGREQRKNLLLVVYNEFECLPEYTAVDIQSVRTRTGISHVAVRHPVVVLHPYRYEPAASSRYTSKVEVRCLVPAICIHATIYHTIPYDSTFLARRMDSLSMYSDADSACCAKKIAEKLTGEG